MEHKVELSYKYQPLFKALKSDKRYIIMEGGRGSGKSVALALFLTHLSFMEGYRILFTRFTMTSAETSIIPEFREKTEWLGNDESFYYTAAEAVNKETGVNILYRGLKPSSSTANGALKSVNGVNIFVLEEALECNDEKLFDRVNLSIRTKDHKNLVILVLNPGDKEHWIYKRFYDEEGNKTQLDDTIYIKTTYLDNLPNLDSSFIKEAEKTKANNYEKYRNEFLGEWVDDKDEAHWTREMIISSYKRDRISPYRRVVIAIDPAMTANKKSDETGIVVAALMTNGLYLVIDDASGVYTPSGWAMKAIELYVKYGADAIIGEVNNGGDLVETNVTNIDKSINFRQVRASRGKMVRAEPIAALYERGEVFHLKPFPKMESQMKTYTGPECATSPDRMDALVWALAELSGSSGSIARVRTI